MIAVSTLRSAGFTVEKSTTHAGCTVIARAKPFSYFDPNRVASAGDIYDSKEREREGQKRHEVLVSKDYTLVDNAEVPITIVSQKEKAVLVDLYKEYEAASNAAKEAKGRFFDRIQGKHKQAAATSETGTAGAQDDEAAAAAARHEALMAEYA